MPRLNVQASPTKDFENFKQAVKDSRLNRKDVTDEDIDPTLTKTAQGSKIEIVGS